MNVNNVNLLKDGSRLIITIDDCDSSIEDIIKETVSTLLKKVVKIESVPMLQQPELPQPVEMSAEYLKYIAQMGQSETENDADSFLTQERDPVPYSQLQDNKGFMVDEGSHPQAASVLTTGKYAGMTIQEAVSKYKQDAIIEFCIDSDYKKNPEIILEIRKYQDAIRKTRTDKLVDPMLTKLLRQFERISGVATRLYLEKNGFYNINDFIPSADVYAKRELLGIMLTEFVDGEY